jgi:dimethylaniline monooxygenase (N-oxide forming)
MLFNNYISQLTRKCFDLDESWRIHPPPSFATHQPTITDRLIGALRDGEITSVRSIRKFGIDEIELEDGMCLKADVVICCTGYQPVFDLVKGLEFTDLYRETEKYSFPRLYQNVFPPDWWQSVAFISSFSFPAGWFPLADLASMAVAQVWKGNSCLPSREAMNAAVDAQHRWMTTISQDDNVSPDFVQQHTWLTWVHEMAGTHVNQHLGYGLQGWWFWLRNPRFCNLLMGGVESPFVERLFDGKRQKWPGATSATLRANEHAKTASFM